MYNVTQFYSSKKGLTKYIFMLIYTQNIHQTNMRAQLTQYLIYAPKCI